MPTTLHENRPSAGIGVVEVQKHMFFCDFCGARATLCGDRRGRGAKTMVFSDFQHARATLCGDRRGRGAKTHGFLRFLKFPRGPLRGSAWSRCKNSRFFAISAVLAQPSAGIGVVEVQKPLFFLRFLRCSRNPLRESAWARCKNSRFFATFVVRTGPRELSRGSRACSRNLAGRGFDSSLVRGRSSQDATCISRKHGEGFFRWVHLSCSHESHYKVSLQGIIIMKVIARSHCKESLQGVIARIHCKECLQGVIARSHGKESLQGVMARSHGKESWQGVIARSHCKESLQGVIARSHCKVRQDLAHLFSIKKPRVLPTLLATF